MCGHAVPGAGRELCDVKRPARSVANHCKRSGSGRHRGASISGARTGLGHPAGITLDGASDLHVSNKANNSVTVYTRGVRGNVAPRRTISGAGTGLNNPRDVVLDSGGNLYVSNRNSITVYAPRARGNAPPRRTISGTRAGLNDPEGMAFDRAGNLHVANILGNSVTVYAPGATGDAPLRTISGGRTGLNSPGAWSWIPPATST